LARSLTWPRPCGGGQRQIVPGLRKPCANVESRLSGCHCEYRNPGADLRDSRGGSPRGESPGHECRAISVDPAHACHRALRCINYDVATNPGGLKMADLGSNVRQIVGGWTTNASKARYPNKPMGVWCSRIIAWIITAVPALTSRAGSRPLSRSPPSTWNSARAPHRHSQ
jgi:hypothetical protein